jgi:hypothetical protein
MLLVCFFLEKVLHSFAILPHWLLAVVSVEANKETDRECDCSLQVKRRRLASYAQHQVLLQTCRNILSVSRVSSSYQCVKSGLYIINVVFTRCDPALALASAPHSTFRGACPQPPVLDPEVTLLPT